MSTVKVNTVDKRTGSTLTLGGCGTTVTLAAGATQSGFGRTGTVDWCTTAKTAPFTGVSGKGYFVNTTCGAVTVTLPASPSAGDIISIADYASTWNTNNVTVCRNGSLINAGSDNATLNIQGQSVTLVYVDGTRGWKNTMDSTSNITGQPNFITATGGTVLTCGNYKTHVFTADGTFCVSSAAGVPANNVVDYYVIAGGGGGAFNTSGAGGGGAGGFRGSNSWGIPAPTISPLTACVAGLSVTTGTAYPITVGGGAGAASPTSGPSSNGTQGNSGSNSVFSTITSAGGGGGGSYSNNPGVAGGSGGGGGTYCISNVVPGGAGNTPPVSPAQGNAGGYGKQYGSTGSEPAHRAGGGGGGAGAAGTDGLPSSAGPGGVGAYLSDTIFGPTAPSYGTPGPVASTRYFSGGGGGGAQGSDPNAWGCGGAGGGGYGAVGAPATPTVGTNGAPNTGGGSGGRYGCSHPGAGGSGIVIIRYKYQ